MPPLADILLLLPLFVLILISAFFSGSETALFSLTGHQQLQLKNSRALSSGKLLTLLAETRSLLITLLLGNMVINVLYFVLSTIVLIRLTQKQTAIAKPLVAALSLTPLLALVLFGELFPKLVASRLAMGWSRIVAVPLWLVHRSITPLRIALNIMVVTPLARLIAPSTAPSQLSSEELQTLLEQSQQHGVLEHDEEQLLQEVLQLGHQKVRHIMTPRVDVKAFDLEDDPNDLLQLVLDTGLSYLPVYRSNLDHIEGVISARRVLLQRPETTEQIQKLLDPVSYVPQVQQLDRLLRHFRDKAATLVIVVDEFGGTAGLVTLEDVVEEMVGEIAGPYVPADEPSIIELKPGEWRVSAGISVHDWARAFGRSSEQFPGVSTLGGLVMAQLGRLPQVGDCTTLGNVRITVDQMDHHRINWLTIELTNLPQADTESS